VKLNDFSISKCEVNNSDYKKFVDDGGYTRKEFWRELIEIQILNTDLAGWDRIQLFVDGTDKPGPSSWSGGTYPEGKGDHPVDGVSWFEAMAYCRWKKVRLPSEAEWEYAARGTDGRIFPWGNDPSVFQNWGVMQGGETTSCGRIPFDKSPFGVIDQARNVAEWVADTWHLYPGAPVDPQPVNEAYGILRGGDYTSQLLSMRTTYRARTEKLKRGGGIGFRSAK
jgi:formylglycine-generating enzyme required for sulfatase activity